MHGYDEYSPEQETALGASVAPYRSPQEAYYKRQHQRTRRYSTGNEMNRNLYRTYSEDHKYSGQSVHSRDVYQVCPDYGPPDTRYYGSTPRRSRRMCPDEYYYDPRGMCCCEEEWYSRNRHHYYANDIPPCPPAPAAASQSSVIVYSPQDANDPRIAVTQEELFHTKPYKHRPMSRSSSRELKANGLGNAPYSQRQSRREDSESEDDIIALNSVPMSAECRCSCDRLVNGSYRQLKEEDSTHFPPDVTQGSKEEVTFYPRHPASTASTSTTSAGCMMMSELLGLARCRQKWLVIGAVLLAAAAGLGVPLALRIQAGASYEERLSMANKLLQEVPLIDGHNDLPWNIRKFVHNRLSEFTFSEDLRQKPPWSNSPWSHTDLLRLRAGHVSAQFWAAYVPCESQFKDAVQLTLEQIDVIKRFTAKYSPPLTFCTSATEIDEAHAAGQLCSLIGVEGGHSLANSLPVLRILYSLGVRYLTLTSTCNTQWADSSLVELPGRKPQHGGLTNFGKIIVKEMNRLGMIVDLSHVSLTTMKAALEVSKAPVVFSHSSARALCNSSRNVPDNILATLGLNGGLVMVNFYSQFLTCRDTATIEDAAAHINHIRNIAGVDSVGLGAGYDGINFTPKGLEDVSTYPALFAELIKTGQWEIEDLKKLAGLNFLRVLKAVEKVRDDMAKSGVEPYEDTISPRYLKGKSNCTSQDPF